MDVILLQESRCGDNELETWLILVNSLNEVAQECEAHRKGKREEVVMTEKESGRESWRKECSKA